ncbi:PIG-L family deacetylase [Actinomadura coerulea]|uniref:PIG-L family deacetylase n=1 Tax=Actinomadura coerulea TaxID=46159 RepID=UPI003416E02C
MGIRIHWYARNGARVHVHCPTIGDSISIRQKECLAAADLLGIEKYTFSSVPDTHSPECRGDIQSALTDVLRGTRPDIVYTQYPADQHLDHTTTGAQVTAAALRETLNMRYFRSPTASASNRPWCSWTIPISNRPSTKHSSVRLPAPTGHGPVPPPGRGHLPPGGPSSRRRTFPRPRQLRRTVPHRPTHRVRRGHSDAPGKEDQRHNALRLSTESAAPSPQAPRGSTPQVGKGPGNCGPRCPQAVPGSVGRRGPWRARARRRHWSIRRMRRGVGPG